MTNLRNFFNSVSGNNRIFTSEDIGEMSPEEFSSNEQAIRNQWGEIGIPSNGELFGSDDVVYVHAYTRGDGTEVRAHYRSKGGGRIGIGTVTGGVSGMGNSVAPDQPTIEEMEKERERMEKESLKILLERSSNSTEGSDINQAITDLTDIFNVLGGFIPDGLMGNVGNFLSDYRENLNNMLRQNGVLTGGAAGVVSNTAVPLGNIESAQPAGGISQGSSMSNFRARRNVNPTKDMGNCQSANVVYQARKQGYDVSAIALDESTPVMMDLGFNPQNAYIDPSTGAPPEVKCSYSYDEQKCLKWLQSNIKTGETYSMTYIPKDDSKGTGHVVEVTKTRGGDIIFYDPQNGQTYDKALLEKDVLYPPEIGIKFSEKLFPQIFRVDNAKINVDILNKISKPRK